MSSLGSPNPLLIGGAKDYEIERSLRFNAGDSPVLTYTPTVDGDRKKLTWSFWWKRSKIDSAEYMITAFNDTNTDRIAVTSDNQLHIELKNGNATEAEFHSKRLFRDPSAWYHIVVAFDTTQATASDRIKAYVNNERITEWDTNDEISQHYYMDGFNTLSKAHDIGAYSGGSGSHSGFCNTYLADIIFIDGIQSTPSDFGETHEKTGQWVPKKYEGTYGLVGTGSYHTGSQVTGSAAFFGGFNLFDGDLNTSCGPISLSTDNSITFTPTTGIAYSSSIRIYAYGAGSGYDITNTFELNGGSPVTFAGDAGTNSFIWVDVASGSGTLTSLKVRLQRPGTSYVRWAAIEIDGTILKTNGVNGYHLNFSDNSNTTAATLGKDSSGNGNNWTPNNFSVATGIGNDSVEDTPTNNFCTLNILGSGIDGSGCDISQGGLYVARNSGSNRFMDSTFTLSSGKWYWEAKTGSSISDYPRIGIWNRGGYQNRLNYPGEGNSGVASDDHVRGWGANGTSFGASGDSASGLPTFSTSEVLMFAMDMDSGKIWFGKDGTWYTDDNSTTTTAAAIAAGTATPKFADLKSGAETQFRQSEKGWTPIAHMNSGDTWEFNFGSRPFAHTPPAGFKSICTKNLPEPDVIKPSEYVGGLKYTGNDFVGTRTFTGLDFNPDLIWHKGRTEHNTHWNCYDKVRGITAGKEILLNSSAAEGAEDGATYGYLSEYTGDGSPGAGGFSHVTGSAGAGNGNAAMNWVNSGTGANYFAHCFKESATAGFDMVTYTGDGTDGTAIAHSLGATPDLWAIRRRDGAGHWVTETNHTHNSRGMHFSNTNGSWTAGTNTVTPSATHITFANSSDTNRRVNISGETYIAYLWASVPGFSKIFGYSGNGSNDGEFVYLGFRPSIVITKATDEAYSWIFQDSLRDPYNVAHKRVWINETAQENTGTDNQIDLLANGIKFRSSAAGNNSTNINHIVIAFAEQTFKYANAR